MTPENQSIAHYRIVSKLGEGGMGAVYRATDTKLNRDVAIKVLPPSLASDAQYMARFEREAQTLASLNHPNIAAIYGIEQGAIVMELVEGEDLRGPLPIDTVIAYARQIAAALEAAHEKGIIHRDLKPANIKVAHDGIIKLLDFGLAKAAEAPVSNSAVGPTQSPTLSLAMTKAGMILGTAGYMPPEQARGHAVDRRADIWAFGVVIYELLTGTPLFQADTVSDTLAAVLRADIDLNRLPPETPQPFRRLLKRCLERDRKRRLPDIAMVRLELDEPAEPPPPPRISPAPSRRFSLAWIVAGVLLVALLALAAANWFRPKSLDPLAVRFALLWPEQSTDLRTLAAQVVPSPDGRNLCMIAGGADGVRAIWVRPLGEPSPHRLDKTEGAGAPFWSPDGQWIAFFADHKLKKIPLSGGVPQTICDAPRSAAASDTGGSGDWNAAGTIVFSTGPDSPLMRVPATGGAATPITKLDTSAGETRHAFPQFLPGGTNLLYFAGNADQSKGAMYVMPLDSPDRRTLVMRSILRAAWSAPGYLLFVKSGTLYAQRMDPKSFRLTGEPRSLAENIPSHDPSGTVGFEVSSNTLVYWTSENVGLGQLVWYGRDGNRQQAVGKPAAYTGVRMTSDDRVAMVSITPQINGDLWTVDLTTGALRRATSDGRAAFVIGPSSPDSKRLAVNLRSSQGVLEAGPTGGNTRVLGPPPLYADDWSPDGQFLFCRDVNGTNWTLLRADGSQQLQPVGNGTRGFYIRFAPDGKNVAYVSGDSGRGEVLVASFPSFAEKRQVSIDGGVHPTWRKDGKELLFQSLTGMVMSAEIKGAGGRIEAGVPKPLFQMQYQHAARSGSYRYWPASDGKRFLVLESPKTAGAQTIVVLNWAAGLNQ